MLYQQNERTPLMIAERLSAQANLGYVPLVDEAARAQYGMTCAEMIATYIEAPRGARLVDPCAGEGRAIADMAVRLGVHRKAVYLNELHDGRAAACKAVSDNVLSCDTLKSLQASTGMFTLAYLNPPFGNDGAEEGGGRLEPKFFRRVVEEGRWVAVGGAVVIVTPQDILQRQESLNFLARCLDVLHLAVLPEPIRAYREVIVFTVVRDKFRILGEQKAEAARLADWLAGDLPELAPQERPLITLPEPPALSKKMRWRDASLGTPEMAQQDVVKGGGAWASRSYTRASANLKRTTLQPLFPLHKAQAALRIAAGAINGMTVEIAGVPQQVKGSTLEEQVMWVEEKDSDKAHVVSQHTITRRVPHVVTIDGQGAIRRYVGDKGMARLMEHEGTAEALLDAVEETAPPRYQLDMPELWDAILSGIVPVSGRALRGYKPGPLPMQKHTAAAAVTAITTPDQGWGGATPRGVIIAAEMGCGKAQALDTNVLTPTGWTPMGAIQVGDSVIGANGRPAQVVGVYPQGLLAIYRVTFSDGSSVECCDDHLWAVTTTTRKFRDQEYKVRPLKEIRQRLRFNNGNAIWYIPMVEPVQFEAKRLPVDPYLMGVLIGDGSLTTSVGFSTADEEIVSFVAAALPAELKVRHQAAYDYRITTGSRGGLPTKNRVWEALKELGLAGRNASGKFIPEQYLFGSVEQRVMLLQGLLDTDGSVSSCYQIEFSTSSEQLARDVQALVQSLGGTARRSSRLPHYHYRGQRREGQRSYRINIALPSQIRPFRLNRKATRYTPRTKYQPTRAITKVELVGHKEAQCIAVDAPDHLYVTEEYIVTHNTTVGLCAAELLRQLNELGAF